MSKLLELIQKFLDSESQFYVLLGAQQVLVQVRHVYGDIVTLVEVKSVNRYDLHYTSVIILSKIEPQTMMSLKPYNALTDHHPLPEAEKKKVGSK
jgi:hypothetical protein